ncbi:hypothetical protein C8J57DRAFT_268102 [Mycena rebaudengoi]|nr:hypothetical protein C8J57DRAFT_268102 [Mycena rebaudengoi]
MARGASKKKSASKGPTLAERFRATFGVDFRGERELKKKFLELALPHLDLTETIAKQTYPSSNSGVAIRTALKEKFAQRFHDDEQGSLALDTAIEYIKTFYQDQRSPRRASRYKTPIASKQGSNSSKTSRKMRRTGRLIQAPPVQVIWPSSSSDAVDDTAPSRSPSPSPAPANSRLKLLFEEFPNLSRFLDSGEGADFKARLLVVDHFLDTCAQPLPHYKPVFEAAKICDEGQYWLEFMAAWPEERLEDFFMAEKWEDVELKLPEVYTLVHRFVEYRQHLSTM